MLTVLKMMCWIRVTAGVVLLACIIALIFTKLLARQQDPVGNQWLRNETRVTRVEEGLKTHKESDGHPVMEAKYETLLVKLTTMQAQQDSAFAVVHTVLICIAFPVTILALERVLWQKWNKSKREDPDDK